jgi:hypothetical protein
MTARYVFLVRYRNDKNEVRHASVAATSFEAASEFVKATLGCSGLLEVKDTGKRVFVVGDPDAA